MPQVTVINNNFIRHQVTVSPQTYLRDVLEEACKKWKLDGSKYGLKNNGKQVNLTNQYRLSGLVNGAKLELTLLSKSPSVVSVALQLPESEASGVPNGRLVDKFPSTTTLWQVLRRFEAGVAGGSKTPKSFTTRAVPKVGATSSSSGRLYYEAPVLHIEGRDHSTLKDLERSLGALGYNSGSVLLRLRFENRDQPFEEAMEDLKSFFTEEVVESAAQPQRSAIQEATSEVSLKVVADAQGDTQMESPGPDITEEAPQIPSEDTANSEAQPAASVSTPASLADIANRPITVLAPPSSTSPQATRLPHNSADYEPTIAHAKIHQARLSENTRNKRLRSDAEIEAEETAQAQKLAQIRDVEIKVRFSDQSSVIKSFGREDTAQTLYAQVRSWLAHESEPFSLNVAGGKGTTALPRGQQKLIEDLKLTGKVLVTVVWEEGASAAARSGKSLKAEVAADAKQISIKEPAAVWADGPAQPSTLRKDDSPGKEKKGAGIKSFLSKLSKK